MIDQARYDCIIHHKLLHTEAIKGPVVDLKLIGFFSTNLEDQVPYYAFEIRSGSLEVGKISLKIGYSQKLFLHGHVGYEIYPSFQGHQYGYHALEMIKELARHHGYRYLIITCGIENEASKRTILRAQGTILMHDCPVPEAHNYLSVGVHKLNVYEISL